MTKSEIPNLDDFGICEGISETIVTTMKDGSPNAAPIGIIRKNGHLFVRLFKGSKTYDNVHSEGILVANIINDPVIFVQSTFSNLEESDFEFAHVAGNEYLVLKEALSWVAFNCKNIKVSKESLIAELQPLHAHINRSPIQAPNRGFNAVLEATIHATRYQISNDEKYLKLIHTYSDIVSKCGKKQDKIAIELIYKFLKT